MKNRKSLLIILMSILIIILGIGAYFYINNAKDDTTDKVFDVYYPSSQTNQLVSEERLIKVVNNKDEMVEKLLKELQTSPKSTNLIKILSSPIEIIDFNLKEKTLQINFSKEYKQLKESQEILLRASLVWTMTELDFVDNVEILVLGEPLKKSNDEQIGLLNRQNVVINPTISPDKINIENVTLYFSDEQGEFLIPEQRNIQIKQSETVENQIIEQLILGPKNKNLFATIPSETKIRNIKTEDGICYVDLSNDFVIKHSGGSSAEVLTIYSIVNSLTELSNVKKVQILIEGEKVNTFKGHLDISKVFERNEELISN